MPRASFTLSPWRNSCRVRERLPSLSSDAKRSTSRRFWILMNSMRTVIGSSSMNCCSRRVLSFLACVRSRPCFTSRGRVARILATSSANVESTHWPCVRRDGAAHAGSGYGPWLQALALSERRGGACRQRLQALATGDGYKHWPCARRGGAAHAGSGYGPWLQALALSERRGGACRQRLQALATGDGYKHWPCARRDGAMHVGSGYGPWLQALALSERRGGACRQRLRTMATSTGYGQRLRIAATDRYYIERLHAAAMYSSLQLQFSSVTSLLWCCTCRIY